MSPLERRGEGLKNVAIPGRLLEIQDDQIEDDVPSQPDDLEPDDLEPDEVTVAARRPPASGGRRSPLKAFLRLYRGETGFDFVGRRRWWLMLSGTIIVAGLVSFSIRGFNFGIDFRGGTSWEITAQGVSQAKVVSAVQAAGVNQPTVQILGGRTIEVQADLNSLSAAQRARISDHVEAALQRFAPDQGVSISTVGPTWGGQVTQHAITALIAFFVVVAIYISLRFEPKMAAAAFVALVHDLLVTAGVYSLFGFQVTPDTVIAILTILGYSLYDTVVVFDRVRDNSRGLGASGRLTYTEMVNLSMNQTLARSINTSLVAIMPVFAILVIGAELLGAITLQDYGLALLIGLLSGAYSSIFIASPILAVLKEREPRYRAIAQRLATRSDRAGTLTPAAAARLATGGRPRPAASGSRSLVASGQPKARPVGRHQGAADPEGDGITSAGPRVRSQRSSQPRGRKGSKRSSKKRR
ncbi:MAG: protein translocase subunit SecF [Acidimicrobiales bacterium]